MEEAYPIFDYLPISFRSEEEANYIRFLWETFEKNYESEKYQFAFLSYHMLFMCFVYFNIWQIKKMEEEDYKKVTLGFHECFELPITPFSFSIENESKIFELFKFWGLRKDHIGNYKKLVKERNEVAHSNGNIIFRTEPILLERIRQILKYTAEIQLASRSAILLFFEKFLIESQVPETRSYLDVRDQIREGLVHENYLSKEDIRFCLEIDIERLKGEENFEEIQSLYLILKTEFGEE